MKAIQRYISIRRPALRSLTTTCNSFQSVKTNCNENIVRSPIPAFSVPDLNLHQFLFEKCEQWHDKTAVVCAETGRYHTFGQLQKLSEIVAQALCAKLKLKKDDTVAVVLPNIPEYATIYFSALRAGIILTTINPAYTSDEIARQLINSSSKAIITLTDNYGVVKNAIDQLQKNENIPIITVKYKQSDTTPTGAINFQELCEYNGPQVKLVDASPDDLAVLPYSSGTSGLPKGVQLTHRNIVSDVIQLQHKSFRLNNDTTSSHQDTTAITVPLFHCYGMIPILFNAFSQGCRTVILPKYSPKAFINLFEKYPSNYLFLVPPIVIMLLNNENAANLNMEQLRYLVSAAAPLSSSDISRFGDKFGRKTKILQYYGLTETGPVTHAQRVDQEITSGSVGCNLPLVESRIVSLEDETKNLGPNENGHLLMRGPNVMPGYHNNPKATEDAIDKDGWFKSGDIAYYNENGEFFITDRIKELIKVKGFQVAPAELEALIREHPDVSDTAVTSVNHSQFGEAPRAFVVPRYGSGLKPEDVMKHVQKKAAKHKHLAGGVVFVDSIPKNPSGKILRRMLKNL